jgi:hypothetical protein
MKNTVLLTALLLTFSLCAGDKMLSDMTLQLAPGDSPRVQLHASEVQLKLQIAGSLPTLLKTQSVAEIQGLHPDQPIMAQTFSVGKIPACILTFGIVDTLGTVHSIGVALVKSNGVWVAATEWSIESGSLGELGFRREIQKFAANAAGTLQRKVTRMAVEGVQAKLDCGCLVCDSRTTALIEDETWQWKAESKSFERATLEKRYVVQPGEGLIAVARKALGDARLMSRIYRLNPELKEGAVLQPGQQILVERSTQ